MSQKCFCYFFAEIVLFVILQAQADYRAVSNSGREFIVAFPLDYGPNPRLEIVISAVDDVITEVYISAPLRQDIQDFLHVNLSDGEVRHIKLNALLSLNGTHVEDKGIWITSDRDITVQCYSLRDEEVENYVAAFMAYPVEALGHQYVIVTNCKEMDLCQFSIVATATKTRLQITLRLMDNSFVFYDNNRYGDSDTIRIGLNTFQTVQMMSIGDMTGSKVESSEPITVIAGVEHVRVVETDFTFDNAEEQLPPLYGLGKLYIIMPFPNTSFVSYVRIVVLNSTFVQINGDTKYFSNDDTYADFQLEPNQLASVQSDAKFLVAQFSYSAYTNEDSPSTNASVAIVTPVSKWRREYVFSSPKLINNTQNTYISIVTNTSCYHHVLLDGVKPMTVWIEDDGGYAYTSFELQVQGAHHRLAVTKQACTLSGNIFGTAWSMPLGWHFQRIWIPEASKIKTKSSTPILESSMSSLKSDQSFSSFTGMDMTDTPTKDTDMTGTPIGAIHMTVTPTQVLSTEIVSDSQHILPISFATPSLSIIFSKQVSTETTAEHFLETQSTTDLLSSSECTSSRDMFSDSTAERMATTLISIAENLPSSAMKTDSVVTTDALGTINVIMTSQHSLVPSRTTVLPSEYTSCGGISSCSDAEPVTTSTYIPTTTEDALPRNKDNATQLKTNLTTTSSPQQPTRMVPGNKPAYCICMCRTAPLIEPNEALMVLKRHLTVNKQNLSTTVRKYVSSEDNRPSAVAMGYSGILFLVITGLVLCISDMLRIWSYFFR